MESIRCISKPYLCHSCNTQTKILAHFGEPSSMLKCPNCEHTHCLEEIAKAKKPSEKKYYPKVPLQNKGRVKPIKPIAKKENKYAKPHPVSNNDRIQSGAKYKNSRKASLNRTKPSQPANNNLPQIHQRKVTKSVSKHAVPSSSALNHNRRAIPVHTSIREERKEPVHHTRSREERKIQDLQYIFGTGDNAVEFITNIPQQNIANFSEYMFGNGLNLLDFFNMEILPLINNVTDFGINFISNFNGNDAHFVVPDPGNYCPVKKSVYKQLPRFKLDRTHCKVNDKNEVERPSCSICCEQMRMDDWVLLLPCGHMFHDECMKPWLKDHNTCPLCRKDMPSEL